MGNMVKRAFFTLLALSLLGGIFLSPFYKYNNISKAELVIYVPAILNKENNLKFKKDFIQLNGVFNYSSNLNSKTIQLYIDANQFNLMDIDKIFLKWGYNHHHYSISKFLSS